MATTRSSTGDARRWMLTLTGKPASQDDAYIFTNEYESLAGERQRHWPMHRRRYVECGRGDRRGRR
jgi:hypothetical protein